MVRGVSFVAALLVALGGRPAAATEFSYKSVVIATIKLSPEFDYDNYADSLMQVFRPAVWQSARNDEFEKEGKKKETIELVKKMVDNYDPNNLMEIKTQIDFGEYDFTKKRFAMHPFTDSIYFNVNNCCTTLPNQINVFFSNPDFLDGIPMEPDRAKEFLNRHKTNGFVNRQLVVQLLVKPVALKGESEMVVEIEKVVVAEPVGGVIVMTLPEGSAAPAPHQ